MRKQKFNIPVVDLNEVLPPPQQVPQSVANPKPLPQALSASKVQGAGGFKIPADYKSRKHQSPVKEPSNAPQPPPVTQIEIFQQLGLKPLSMEQAQLDKQRIANQVSGPLVNHPISKSSYFDANLQIIQEERKQLQTHIDAKQRVYSPNYEEIPEEESFQEKLQMVSDQISKHYDRIGKLEKEFLKQPEPGMESDKNYENIQQKIKALQIEKKAIKEQQLQDRQEYEEERRKREQRVTVQIEELKKQKQQKLLKAKERVFEHIEAKPPEQQIYEHQYQEYRQEKMLKQTVEKKMKELDKPEFDKYKSQKSYEKLPPKQALPDQVISNRPVTVVNSLKELHLLQLANYSPQQLGKLDPQLQKTLFQTVVEQQVEQQSQKDESSEQFVLQFTFSFIDKDGAGVISKSEALQYLQNNKDIQVIFQLDLKMLGQQIESFVGRRAGMLDFKEYCQLLQKCKGEHENKVKEFKEKSMLQLQNREETFHQAYQTPLKQIFSLLDIKEEGVVGRVEFVKTTRNQAAKTNSKLLSLHITQQPGSPSVNHVLERILSDYRKNPETSLISWNQITQYFNEPIPTQDLGLLQARIILAHFGPGSIASDNYYQKMKNRCILEHHIIQQLLECFMKVDSQCDLIIEKSRLIEEVRIRLEEHLNKPAVHINQINKQFSLERVLQTIEESIIEEKNDTQYISLQQFTETLTNYIPPQPKLPALYFGEGEKPDNCLVIHLKQTYFQILADCFDMVPRVFNDLVLKEEFIALVKKDPQTRCLLNQQAREDGETMGQVLNKLQMQEAQIIHWSDVVYFFSEKASLLQQEQFQIKPTQSVKQQFNSNLRRSDFFMFNPPEVKVVRQKETILQGPAIGSGKLDIFTAKGQQHSEDEIKENDQEDSEGQIVLNNSFDEGDLRQMKVDYDSYAERVLKMRNARRSITVPKQPLFHKQKKSIRQKRLEKMIMAIEEKVLFLNLNNQEEFELNNKFRANPIATNLNVPMHHILELKASERKMKNISQMESKPFSFYYKDIEKYEKKKMIAHPPKQQQFKAKDVPMGTNMDVLKQKELEGKKRREDLVEKKKQDMITNTAMPARLQEAEKKRLEKLEKMKNLKPSDIDPECKFNPKIKKLPPKKDEEQTTKDQEKILQNKESKKKALTQAKPFPLSDLKTKSKGQPTYLDEDNQRRKVKEEPKKKQQNIKQKPIQENDNEAKDEEAEQQQEEGEPQQDEGEPQQEDGEPQQEDGEQQQEDGEQQQDEGEPQQDQGEPQQEDGEPQQIEGEPQQEDGEPQQEGDQQKEEEEEDQYEEDKDQQEPPQEEEETEPVAQEEQPKKQPAPSQQKQKPENPQPKEIKEQPPPPAKAKEQPPPQAKAKEQPPPPAKAKEQPPPPVKAKEQPPLPAKPKEQVDPPPQQKSKQQEPPQPPQKVQAQPEKAASEAGEKKEKKKVLSSQERELQMLQEQKDKQKLDKQKAQEKLGPDYQLKLKEQNERLNQRDLMVTKKQHGSSTLDKYKKLAQKQAEEEQKQQTEGGDDQLKHEQD